MKAGEVARDHSLNASIAKSFHRMYLAAVKSKGNLNSCPTLLPQHFKLPEPA
jgi:hypothetical protein